MAFAAVPQRSWSLIRQNKPGVEKRDVPSSVVTAAYCVVPVLINTVWCADGVYSRLSLTQSQGDQLFLFELSEIDKNKSSVLPLAD